MKVELIPVIEICRYNHSDHPSPQKRPYWDYPDEWNKYNSACLALSGFADLGDPYLPGSSFYHLLNVSEVNIINIVRDKFSDLKDGKYPISGVSPLSGGSVLKINDVDILFPQCCGDLSDIAYWESISGKHESEYYPGHPQPVLEINEQNILFDFKTGEFDEHFVPPPPIDQITVNKHLLKDAVNKAKADLQIFAEKLIKINKATGMNIPDIDNLLIWDK